ncbi:hypothetical protein CHH28_03315 [Bacterioplanes sanyensis]|uniref:YecA family protein n=1 Tax=Bacterioplanes sanyensis TaxID=1249553 RepID=A0A222FH61_9GAMM|nr:UPF0149 family protein [Bacterioplanes sanyensis]ASP37761.1 hypothetical protein CHH28_03315 [Bacterioplanes sanyensis]
MLFSDLADIWLQARCFQTPSALHGWLTGFLSAGGRLKPDAWMREASDYLEMEDALDDGLSQALANFYPAVLQSLAQENMQFQPLLPDDDDADVDEQLDCLVQWSKGFLDGFGASGNVQGQLPADVTEVLRDLDAFTGATLEDPADPENEFLLQQLTEHARMAALTVFYSLNQSPQSPAQPLH